QDRRVNVDAPEPWERQHLSRKDEAVGHNDETFRIPGFKRRPGFLARERLGLDDRQAVGERGTLHGTRLDPAAATARPVGLRQHPDDAMPLEQRLEGGQREFRRAGKGDAQRQYARRAPYMVSNMSSISVPRAASKRVTGCARVRSRGSGYSRMVLRAMGRACNMGAAAPVIQRTNLTLNRMPAGCHASITTKISAAGAQVRPRNEEWRMVSNQVLVARLATGLLILGFALSGCSHFRSHQQASTESAAPATVSGSPSSGTPAEPEVTATEAAANAAGTRTVVE